MIVRIQFGDPPLDNHFFETNLTLLQKHLSKPVDLKNQLTEKITIINANSGQPTIRYEGILLHSKYDPNKEGIDFAKNIKSGSRIFLYGFGLGYHLEPLLQKIGFMFCVTRGVNYGGNPVARRKSFTFSEEFMIKTLLE